MKSELLLDNPDLTLGFYRYVIYSNGEKKYLQLRLEDISRNSHGIESSKIETEIVNHGKSIGATSCKIFHADSKNSEPREIKSIEL